MSGIGKGEVRVMRVRHVLVLLLSLISQLGCIQASQAQSYSYGPPYTYNTANPTGTTASLSQAVEALEADNTNSCLPGVNKGCPPSYQVSYGDTSSRLAAVITWTNGPQGSRTGTLVSYATETYNVGWKNIGSPVSCQCKKGGNGGSTGSSNPSGGRGDNALDSQSIPGSTYVADPINASNGNKFEQDTDFRSPGAWLTFRRFYNSAPGVVITSTFGPQWRHSFDRSLEFLRSSPGTSGSSFIMLTRPDGSREQFTLTSGLWTAQADTPDTLTEQDDTSGNPICYTVVIAATRQIEQYSSAGLLQSITDPVGTVITLTYSTASTPVAVAPMPNLLLTVTDPQQRSLSLTYNSSGTIAQLTLPDGGVLTYGYDTATGNLTSVKYPDGKTRQYVYNESAFNSGTSQPHALTGLVDETGTRFESTGYSASGRAFSSSFAGGADAFTISYGSLANTVTTPLGRTTNLSFQNVLGAMKTGGSSQSCGDACNEPYQYQNYDANGYPTSVTDWNNVVTKTTYDANGLLDQEVDASGATTPTTWNIPLRVPLTRTVLNASGTIVAQMAWVYNAAGQPTAQ